jgi:uncharacterized protein YchJ
MTATVQTQALGLATQPPVLPSESPARYEAFRAAVLDRFAPKAPEDIATVVEYIDVTWRLRRIPAQEAELIALEIQRIHDDPALNQLVPTLTPTALEALALERLFNGKALLNLHRLENNLNRRLARMQPNLDFLAERANEREYLRRQTQASSSNAKPALKLVALKNGHPLRNDLCPCGSGLKYKRCCDAHLTETKHPEAA